LLHFNGLFPSLGNGKSKGKVVLKAYWASGGIAPRILDLGTRWR